jgi:hypothetical protein
MQFTRAESGPKPEQSTVVAVEPGDVAARRRPRAAAGGGSAQAKGRNGTPPAR